MKSTTVRNEGRGLDARFCQRCGAALCGGLGGVCDRSEREHREICWGRWKELCPPKYLGVSFKALTVDVDNRTAIAEVKKWAAEPAGFLFLHGPAGTGKTVLALAAARDMIAASWRPVRFTTAPNLFQEIKDGFDHRFLGRKAGDVIDGFKDKDRLIVDDLATMKSSDWTIETFMDLIDHRYSHCLSTVITSNLGGAELARIFGSRVASRIKGDGVMIELGGRDRRLDPGRGLAPRGDAR